MIHRIHRFSLGFSYTDWVDWTIPGLNRLLPSRNNPKCIL